MTYRLLIDISAVNLIQSLRKPQRERLLAVLSAIREYPERYSDYQGRDSQGTRVEIHVAHGLAIHYWIDNADRHVKVLCIQPADG